LNSIKGAEEKKKYLGNYPSNHVLLSFGQEELQTKVSTKETKTNTREND